MRTLATLNALEFEEKLTTQSMPTESGSPSLHRNVSQSAATPPQSNPPHLYDLPEPNLPFVGQPSRTTAFGPQHSETKVEYKEETYAEPYAYPVLDRNYYDQLLQNLCRSVNGL